MERIPLFYQAIEVARQEGKKARVTTLEAGIQKLRYLLQRAEVKIPIYKKDLPCPPALGPKFRKQTEEYRQTVELLTKMSGLSARAAKLAAARGDSEMEAQLRNNAKALTEVLHDYEMGKPLDMSTCPYSLADIERLADQAGVPATRHIQDTETVRLRINQYKLAALKAKRAGQTDLALQHMRVVKGLQPLMHAAEKGEDIDMTQVPPPPSEQTPTTEEAARVLTETAEVATEEEIPEPEIDFNGKSLAEELSAFLEEMPSPEHRRQDTEGGVIQPAVTRFTESPPSAPMSLMDRQRMSPAHKGLDVCLQPAPAKSGHTVSSQGAQTVRSYGSSHQELSTTVPHNVQPQFSGQSSPSGRPGKDRERSPDTSSHQQTRPGLTMQPQRVMQVPPGLQNGSLRGSPERMNSSHGNRRSLEGQQDLRQQVTKTTVGDRSKGQTPQLIQDVGRVSRLTNGTQQNSPVLTCIEILKYERMVLDKELASEQLTQQMEEEKQRLRSGGYEAWLAYLGQVEEDVGNINSNMKQAREMGMEDVLGTLIIKKELAERELALMRKRLPELQA
ncbi:hypothetical protein BaRGS_00006615 [Batillaria attramentaria]|uniref:DM14 domain-containing protein n=1 Tax=Batillaria attramentaria TaxID=370345 RepID=A0ABD0LSV9_9CAEN